MNDSLATYIHDHLAGATCAIDLIETLRDRYAGQPLGQFAADLHREVSLDRNTLRDIATRTGDASSKVKEAAAWMAEKVSRMKLQHSDANGLGTFEALEFLQLGIHGKLSLWRALAEIAPRDSRLAGFDFTALMDRARDQEAMVEAQRLAMAPTALLSEAATSRA